MKILALETSAKSVSAAVIENNTVLASTYQNTGLTHSRTLMPLVDGMLRSAGFTVQDMDLSAVANGPGSFTGLRIGISAAKGLAWTLELPCCGVSTLLAMAQNLRFWEGEIICAMDARRHQVYNAVFSSHAGDLARVCEDRPISLDDLYEEERNSSRPKIIVGDGAQLCYNYFSEKKLPCRLAPPQLLMQNAVGVALAAEELAAQGKTVSARDLVPVYLRLSQAERERLAKGLKITVD